MTTLRPWYTLVQPRTDIRENKAFDAADLAVNLDHVLSKRAPEVYTDPKEFFERTYLTENLKTLAAGVVRRMAGVVVETSAVYNLATQFGGGKTHALTLLYHLATHGAAAAVWDNVRSIKTAANDVDLPITKRIATFVGTGFDTLAGRGEPGEPKRYTPWGEIAFRLAGAEGYALVAEHDQQRIAPSADVLTALLTHATPTLILMDEVMNYISRARKSGNSDQFHTFLQNLTETARGMARVAVVVSLPVSEFEMTAEDEADYKRLDKLMNRVGQQVVVSGEGDTHEIIRRRLFDWKSRDAKGVADTIKAYAEWIDDKKDHFPGWIPNNTYNEVQSSYPFHPSVLSVFDRKWQTLPSFQRTRGVLRMLALWVSRAYTQGKQGKHKESLIMLGKAPLEDDTFRTAVLSQVGEERLGPVIATDIVGRELSHAVRLDQEAKPAIKEQQLHRQAATIIFFESRGGQTTRTYATLPEVRLALSAPTLDISNVETVLEGLRTNCYYLQSQGTHYHFELTPNLNAILADRLASVRPADQEKRVREEIQKIFETKPTLSNLPIPFPTESGGIPNMPRLTLAYLDPEYHAGNATTHRLLDHLFHESGSSNRQYKSALIIAVADQQRSLLDAAKRLLAWQTIRDNDNEKLDEAKQRTVQAEIKRAEEELKERIWSGYRKLYLMGKDNQIQELDLGQFTSSHAPSLSQFVVRHLTALDLISENISPNFLARHWPPALTDWATSKVRDAFFATPAFPRVKDAEVIRRAIADGVKLGFLGYATKEGEHYRNVRFNEAMSPAEVEIAEDVYLIPKEVAERNDPKMRRQLTRIQLSPREARIIAGDSQPLQVTLFDQFGNSVQPDQLIWRVTGNGDWDEATQRLTMEEAGTVEITVTATALGDQLTATATIIAEADQPPPDPIVEGSSRLYWSGELTPQKWMNFYMKVISKFVNERDLKLTLRATFDAVRPIQAGGVSREKADETRIALRELQLNDRLEEENLQ